MATATRKYLPKEVQNRKDLDIRAGDTVRVHVKIEEKGKTRIQKFEGLVLATKHGTEPGATFRVRKVSSGVGVERTFPLYSPMIDKIEIIKRSKVRRAKLYYIREKVSRQIRRKMRKFQEFFATTDDLIIPEEEMMEETPEEAEETAQPDDQPADEASLSHEDATESDEAKDEQKEEPKDESSDSQESKEDSEEKKD